MSYKVFKTHTFEIHNLSETKKAQIEKTLKQNEMLYYKALQAVEDDAYQMLMLDKSERRTSLIQIKKKLQNIVKPLPFGNALKASIIEDVAAQVSSFVELKLSGQDASYPTKIELEIQYNDALNALINSLSKDEEDAARKELTRAHKNRIRPLSFAKYRESDGFMILADDKNRCFAFLNLWSAKDKRAKKISMSMTDTRTGEHYKKNTATGLLLPLSFANWHRDALKKGTAKTAKFYERKGNYYLAVAVEYIVERRETINVIGIDRGIEEIASYAVRDKNGKVLKSGNFDGLVLREHQRKLEEKQKTDQKNGKKLIKAWSNYSDNLIHHIANEIVKIADKYNAQVVMEDLTAIKNNPHHKRKKFARKTNFNRMLSRQQYGKLEAMLEYKLNFVGLPKPFFCHAAYTSLTCPVCGNVDKSNRVERDKFCCTECHYAEHADVLGSINIAAKKIWLDQIKGKFKKGSIPENLKFQRWQADNLTL